MDVLTVILMILGAWAVAAIIVGVMFSALLTGAKIVERDVKRSLDRHEDRMVK
jgi:hypothetical protein